MKRFIACELAKKTANSHGDEALHFYTLHGIRTWDHTIHTTTSNHYTNRTYLDGS